MTSTSVHVLRFPSDRTWDDLRAERPASATYWHPGVTAARDEAGIPQPDLRSWTVVACWEQPADWSSALTGPGPWQGATRAWSALLRPGPTRYLPAPARWADGRAEAPFGSSSPGSPRGEVGVLTTVGLDGDDLAGALRFVRDVEEVVGTLATTPGCRGFRIGAAEHFPSQTDAFTFSLWSDVRSAHAWAYGEGVHARAVAEHQDGTHITRGSFTTFSVLETVGSWSGRHLLRTGAPA